MGERMFRGAAERVIEQLRQVIEQYEETYRTAMLTVVIPGTNSLEGLSDGYYVLLELGILI